MGENALNKFVLQAIEILVDYEDCRRHLLYQNSEKLDIQLDTGNKKDGQLQTDVDQNQLLIFLFFPHTVKSVFKYQTLF